MEIDGLSNHQIIELIELFCRELINRQTDCLKTQRVVGEYIQSREERAARAAAISHANRQAILAIQNHGAKHGEGCRSEFFEDLIAQDWGAHFSGDIERQYYVYAHLDPDKRWAEPIKMSGQPVRLRGQPFYIGKGSGDRAWCPKRNEGHGVRLRQCLKKHPMESLVHIFKDQMTEAEALALEAKLIYFFGTIYHGDKRGSLVNLNFPTVPFSGVMQAYPSKAGKHITRLHDGTKRIRVAEIGKQKSREASVRRRKLADQQDRAYLAKLEADAINQVFGEIRPFEVVTKRKRRLGLSS